MRKVAADIPENSLELIATIVRKVTGLETKSIEHISGKGMSNAVTKAYTAEGRFVVRTNIDSHLSRYEREAWCIKQLKKTPVLTPEILGCGIEGAHSYSLAPYIEDSTSIHDGNDIIRVWRILGEYASYLNKIKPPEINDPAIQYFTESWERQIVDDVETIFKDDFWVNRNELSYEQQNRLREYLLGNATFNAPQGICQFDLSIGNALICNSNYNKIYLIDFEWVNIAPVPFYQLACISADKGYRSEISNSFFAGYGVTTKQATDIDLELNRFILQRVMRATAWARDRCPSLIDANIKRSRAVIDRTFRDKLC